MHRLKVKGWKKTSHANGNKKAGAEIFISDKKDFKTNALKKKGPYTMIKRSIHKDDITLIYIYEPETGLPRWHIGKESAC